MANTARDFDYVVVGAGSAGCAIATRLAEDPTSSVLLIEAGPKDWNPWIHVPAGYYRTIRTPSISWGYKSEPAVHLNGRQVNWPRGKVLGGSGAINGLVYIRGHPVDFEHWKSLGNEGWGWDDVLPFFLKCENQERGVSKYHSTSGPIRVSDIKDRREVCDAFIKAGKSFGLQGRDDFNAGHQDGIGYYQLTMGRGRRSSPAAYLRQAKHANLAIVTNRSVVSLMVENCTAIGVNTLSEQGQFGAVRARREIIVSCGAIGSPHLLQSSGIGPADVLKDAGVPVAHDLSGVGRNLTDRLQIRSVFRCNTATTLNDVYGSVIKKVIAGMRYAFFQTGPLTVGAGQAAAFLRTAPHLDRPDLELTFMAFSTPGPGQKPHKFSGFTLLGYPLQPKSRGSIALTSPDISEPPRIDPGYLNDPYDLRMLEKAFWTCRAFADQPALKSLIVEEHMPGNSVQSQAQLEEYIRNNATSVFHSVGTCQMGVAEDPKSVVDSRLRVHGIRGLRVADASIMPTIVSGNTNATTMMIGEKAAAMIKEDWSGR